MTPSASEIIRSGTTLSAVPLVPEIRLHLAAEPIAVWEHTEVSLGRAGLPPPYWAFAWAGGQALARHLLDHPRTVQGRRVLDMAAGSGLVAIAAALAGAADVTACDVDPLSVAAIALNAAANGVGVTVRGGGLEPAQDSAAEVVLIADAFYQRHLAVRMTAFADRARAHGAAVLIADPGRAYLPRSQLVPLACYDVPDVGALEDSASKRTTIWAPRS